MQLDVTYICVCKNLCKLYTVYRYTCIYIQCNYRRGRIEHFSLRMLAESSSAASSLSPALPPPSPPPLPLSFPCSPFLLLCLHCH